jgi:hypothetical protein
MSEALRKRFDELISLADKVSATQQRNQSAHYGSYDHVDSDMLLRWCVRARNLLVSVCGPDSEHYNTFVEAEKPRSFEDNTKILGRVRAVFLAAKEDFEGGYLTSIRHLVRAEVFSTELEQARELLASGYKVPAAVISGVVLETNLRSLCDARDVPVGKLEKMNADLTKTGQYNSLVQKRITALAAIRNSAAHGKHSEFNEADVSSMIDEIEKLVAGWLS